MHIRFLPGLIIFLAGTTSLQALDLYVDTRTRQLYAEPGPDRVKLGTFERMEDRIPSASATTDTPDQAIERRMAELRKIEQRVDEKLKAASHAGQPVPDTTRAQVNLGEKGLGFESGDGQFKTRLGGRIQVDSQVNFNEPDAPDVARLGDNLGLRRARVYTEGTLFHDYDYRFEYDWARNGGGTQGITDAFIRYTYFKPFNLTIGQLNEGKGLESSMSNNFMTFIERPLPHNALIEAGPASKYQLGIMGDTHGTLLHHPYTLKAGITTESLGAPAPGNSANNSQGNINRNAFSGDIGYQWVGRATFVPYRAVNSHHWLHTGIWGSWRDVNNHYNEDGSYRNGGWQFVAQPDANMDRTNWINTGNLTATACAVFDAGGHCIRHAVTREVANIAMFGAELAGVFGPGHFTAEYMQADVSGTGYGSDDTLRGYSAYAGWFLTGETRPYDENKGLWNRLVPHDSLIGGHGWGAWEVAARYDLMDMNTPRIAGGSVNTATLALNWYLNSHVRLMTNWVHVFDASTARAGTCTSPANGSNPAIACFNGLGIDLWETALRMDF
jgi:phosphate-selective porin OprO/OprP